MVLQSVENVLMTAQTLKDQLLHIDNIATDEVGMVCQQKLQKIYHDALIHDLEFSLDQKAEVDLWNHGFRNSIVMLQTQARDKKNPQRDESECRLTRFLESASAFYAALLHDVCSAFDLELPFRRNGRNYACPKRIIAPKLITKPNKNSCYYMCQYCLVHLGDLARYRHLGRQAELFYRYAVQLSPCSGHPYNQLALVEAARGDRLSTVFYYVRSVSVRHPFPAAALNLMKTLNQYVDEQIDIEGRVKLSVSECVTVFLRFHGLLSKSMDLDVAEKYVKLLTNTLTALVATESFSGTQLVQMLAINLYALHQKRESAFLNKTTVLSEPGLESDELQAKRLVLHLVAGSLSAFLLPVYTLKDGESLLDYFALPAIKLTLDWIRLESHVLLEAAFLSRRQIWPSLCKLLNVIQSYLRDFSADRWAVVPLPEDRSLQCFIPLEGLLNNYRFAFDEPKMEPGTTNKVRATHLVQFGAWLSQQEKYSLLKMRKETGEREVLIFELAYSVPTDVVNKAVADQPVSTTSALPSMELCKPFAVGDIGKMEVTSEQVLSSETQEVKPDEKISASMTEQPQTPAQTVGPGIMKKGRQNVAMQAILKKMDQDPTKPTESKQVTFRTPSPTVQVVDKKTPYKQQKSMQEKPNVIQPTNKTDRNKATVESSGKSVSFSLPRVRETNTLTEKLTHKVQDRIRVTPIHIQDKNLDPEQPVTFLGPSNSSPSHSNQDKNYSLPVQNSQKKNVTFSDDKILSFAAQVLQGRAVTSKSIFSSPVHNEKTGPFHQPPTKDKAVPYPPQGIDYKALPHISANITEKPPPFPGMLNQAPPIRPQAEPSAGYPPRSVEPLGLHAFGSVGSFSQALFKTPLFELPDLRELHNPPESGQIYPANSDLQTVSVSQYSTEPNRGHGNTYSVRETIRNSEFANISDVVPPAIGSEHSGLNPTHSPACVGNVRPTPPLGYGPETPLTWWKREAPMTMWWKVDAPSERVENAALRYPPVNYESATKPDPGYVNHMWNANTTVDVNLHHKLVGAYPQPPPPASAPAPEAYRTEVPACNVDSYIDSGPTYSIPPADSTYSLFSSTQWTAPPLTHSSQPGTSLGGVPGTDGAQSLWSGPGPSPLERLLEQQKRLREGPLLKKGT